MRFSPETPAVRVKRWGKSPPASWRHGGSPNPVRCKVKQVPTTRLEFTQYDKPTFVVPAGFPLSPRDAGTLLRNILLLFGPGVSGLYQSFFTEMP